MLVDRLGKDETVLCLTRHNCSLRGCYSINMLLSRRQYASTAPNPSSTAFCAALIPVAPAIFIPTYGPSARKIFRDAPDTTSHSLIVPSALPLTCQV